MKGIVSMAKKKQVVIVDQELVPTTLAIKQDKKKVSVFGVVWIFIIFAIFIGGVIYLPTIAQYISDYLNPIPDEFTGGNDNNNQKDDDTQDVEVTEFKIADNPTITQTDFEISNVNIVNNTLSLNIKNLSKEILDFSKYHYFINLFDDNKKLVQRIMLNDEIIAIDGIETFTYNLKDTTTSIISLVTINVVDYPAYVASKNENGTATLVCTKDYETISYLLNDNKVYAIQDVFSVDSTDANFNTLYGTYQAMATAYGNINGMSSTLNIVDGKLDFRTIINLNVVDIAKINNKMVYPKDTDAKVMKFELETKDYVCQ